MGFRKVASDHIKKYRSEVLKDSSASTFDRKMFSLKKFFEWAVKEGYADENPIESFLKAEAQVVETKLGKIEKEKKANSPSYNSTQARIIAKLAGKPKLQKLAYHAFYTRPKWYNSYHNLPIAGYFNYAILVLLMSSLGFGVYNQFFKTTSGSLAYPTTLTTAGRYLSFQGRLTNNLSNPVTTATNLVFKLYSVDTGGTALWDSSSCSISPDTDGIFSTLLGSSCGTEIPASVFSENSAIWLGVTVGVDAEATPRVQIATVAYAINSETLQGYPASSSATANTVPVMNNLGQIVLAAASPKMQSTSGTFAIEGQALTITTPDTSNGSIAINPDGTGTLNLIFEGAAPGGGAGGFVNATNANITSGALYFGQVASNATGYNLLQLKSGATPTDKFTVDYAGNLTAAGTINGLTVSSGTISSGTWNGTAISTTYGGTGQNWSGVAQGSLPYFSATGTMSTLSPGTSGYVLTTQGASADPTWTAASGLGTNYWNLGSGTIYPGNTTLDLLLGSSATTSAKFAFKNVLTGVPTASISGSTANVALFMDGNGNISTTNRANLVLGNSATYNSTGNILLNPNGTGNVGIGTTTPANYLEVNIGTDLNNSKGLTVNAGSTQIAFLGDMSVAPPAKGALKLYNGSTQTVQIGSAGVSYINAGNFGIGTITPTAKLDVVGDASASASLVFRGATPTIDILNGSTLTFQSSPGGDAGLTSIATLTPTGNLTVNGTLNGLTVSSGTISSGTWNGTAVGTQWGGTGQNWSGVAQGSIPYFGGTGTMTTLAPTTSGYVLTTQGTGANPTWTQLPAAGVNYWQLNGLVLSPANAAAYDIAIGGTSTASAKFLVNAATGNLTTAGTASVSGSLTFGAGAGTIAATNMAHLTIGGATTGGVDFASPITSGTWNGTAIGATYGGTGQTSYAVGDLLYANTTTSLAKLADVATGNVLISGGINTAPSWGKVVLGTHTTGNYVSTITGTANQITASASTGDITLSIPTDFRAPGTVNAVNGIYTGATAGTQRIDASGNLVNIANISASGYATVSGSIAIGNTTAAVGPGNLNMSGNLTFAGALMPGGSAGTSGQFLTSAGAGATPTWTSTVPASSVPFSGITSGTNTTAAMVVGAGSSLTYSGGTATSGVINANQLLGATWASPLAIGTTAPAAGNFTTIGATTQGTAAFTTLSSTGATTLGNNTNTVAINSNDWDISTTGDMTGIGGISMNGAITGATGFNGLVVTANTGVVTTGTWNGSLIGAQWGGTGANNSTAAQYSVPYYSTTGVLGGVLTPGTAGYVLSTNSTGGAPTWTAASGLGTNYWALGSGTIYPGNTTLDLLLGSSATTSAKFAFKNVLTGVPTASISGSTANVATFIDGNGNISTTNRQDLVLGNSATYNSTGNVLINPNGTGKIGLGTTSPLNYFDVHQSVDNTATWWTDATANVLVYNIFSGSASVLKLAAGTGRIVFGAGTASDLFTISSRESAGTTSEYFAINNNGDVGIGTTTPSQKFTISQGDIQIDDTTNANQNGIIYKETVPFIHNFNYGNNGTVTTDGHNTFVGKNAGNFTMGSTATQTYEASYNTSIGEESLKSNTTGSWNTANGYDSLFSNTTGIQNVAIGNEALRFNTSGAQNTAIGHTSLYNITTSGYNTALGYRSGYSTTGWGNLMLGFQAGDSLVGGLYNIVIGYNIDLPTTSSSNMLDIGNLIYATGIDGTGTTLSTGKVGIGTASPLSKLSVITTAANATGKAAFLVDQYESQDILTASASGITKLTLTNAGNLNIAGVLNAGGLSGVAYNAFAGSGDTPAATTAITASNDLFVGGDIEIKGGLYLTGKNIFNVVGGVATSTISLAQDPAAIDNYNALSYGSWLVNNSTNNGIAALMVNQNKGGDIFTASASGSPKFVIDNSGNVGIGTTNPLETLHISSSVATGLYIETTDSTTYDPFIELHGAGTARGSEGLKLWYDNSAGSTYFDNQYSSASTSEGSLYFRTKVSGTPVNALTIIPTGDVGIGTTSPGAGLDVAKTNAAAADIIGSRVTVTQPSSGALTAFAYRTIVNVTHTSGTLSGVQSNSSQLSFTGNGGTTSYAEGLTSGATVGTGAIVTNLSMAKLYSPANSGTITSLIGLNIENMSAGSSSNYSIYSAGGTMYHAGNVGIGLTGPIHKLDVTQSATTNGYAAINALNNGINVGTAYGVIGQSTGASVTNVGGYFSASGATNNYGLIVNAGNVGIGTAAPAALLHLTSTTAPVLRIDPGANTTADPTISLYDTSTAAGFQIVYDNDVGSTYLKNLYNAASGDIYIQTKTAGTPVNALFIESAGDVGIGTTTPAGKLHVSGSAVIDNGAVGTYLHLTANSTPGYLFLQTTNNGGSGYSRGLISNDLNFDTANSVWNVPTNGTVNDFAAMIFRNSGSTMFVNKTSTGSASFKMTDANLIANYASMTITSAGNVGIGTSAPAANLDISDTNANVPRLHLTDSTNGAYTRFMFSGGTSDNLLYIEPITPNGTAGSTIRMFRNTSTTGAVKIDVFRGNGTLDVNGVIGGNTNSYFNALTGNVGIGTSGPTSKLSVAGAGSSAWQTYIQGSGTTSSTYGIVIRESTGATNNFWIRDDGAGYLRAAAWTYGSDRNLKENINYFNNGLDTILALNPVQFDYIQGEQNQLGFIAQDVQKIIPQAVVVTDTETGMLGLKTEFITPFLVNAIKEQQTQIASLSAQLADINLTSTGDLNISTDSNGNYQVTDTSSGAVITNIGAFAQAVIANIKAGAIVTEELATNSFTAFQGTVDNMLVKSGLVSPIVQTALISPLPGDTDVTVQIGSATESGKLAIQNAQGTEVASIDSSGSAEFKSASISGELYADTIKSKTLDEIQAILTQVQVDQNLLSQSAGWNVNTATDSASLIDTANIADLYVTNQAAINSLSVTNSLTIGSDMVIQSVIGGDQLTMNSIDTLSSPLRIQSLAMAPIEIMAGLIRIDTEGNVQIAGNLAVAGRIKSSGLSLQEENLQATSAQGVVFNVQDAMGSAVATIDASGSASFGSISTPQLVIAGADATESGTIINGVITTNSTIGQAVIPAGVSEITIKNPKVTDYTLVYVTPTSTTENYVLYVKSKKVGEFVVGFTNPISIDVNFNWWIVRVTQ